MSHRNFLIHIIVCNGNLISRTHSEKIGQLLKTYGVAQLSDLPAEKYEAFLADVAQI